eukprot:SAG31_NODE_2744_length_5150_cov_4.544249_1_plen_137_part_10
MCLLCFLLNFLKFSTEGDTRTTQADAALRRAHSDQGEDDQEQGIFSIHSERTVGRRGHAEQQAHSDHIPLATRTHPRRQHRPSRLPYTRQHGGLLYQADHWTDGTTHVRCHLRLHGDGADSSTRGFHQVGCHRVVGV